MIRDWRTLSSIAIGIRVISLVSVGFIAFHLYTIISEYDYSLDEQKWEQEYLLVYLNSQPEKTMTIQKAEATNTDSDKAISSVHLKKEPPTAHISFSPVQKDGSKQEVSTHVKIKQAKADTAPYLTYKTIEKDISEHYTEDMYYETTLYINQDSQLYK